MTETCILGSGTFILETETVTYIRDEKFYIKEGKEWKLLNERRRLLYQAL